jgi:hypothetical protein
VSAKTRSWERAKEESGEPTKRYSVAEAVEKYLASISHKLEATSMQKPRRMMSMLIDFCNANKVTYLSQISPIMNGGVASDMEFQSRQLVKHGGQ